VRQLATLVAWGLLHHANARFSCLLSKSIWNSVIFMAEIRLLLAICLVRQTSVKKTTFFRSFMNTQWPVVRFRFYCTTQKANEVYDEGVHNNPGQRMSESKFKTVMICRFDIKGIIRCQFLPVRRSNERGSLPSSFGTLTAAYSPQHTKPSAFSYSTSLSRFSLPRTSISVARSNVLA
jgi:hypothetical protein